MHIGSVVVSLLFPLITVITPIIDYAVKRNRASDGEVILGFTISLSPAPCFATDAKVRFYSSIIPTIIIAEIGVVLLILTIWLINKVYCTICKYYLWC